MKYRAFAIDLDGTLLEGEDIPQGNIEPLRRAAEAGVHVMIATARWRHIAERIAGEIGIQDLIIACSGAHVYNSRDGSDVFDHRLPRRLPASYSTSVTQSAALQRSLSPMMCV